MDDADTIQPLNARPPYEAGDADAFFAHVGSGGKVEADDWMPDEYRAAVLKFVEMHANSELMGVLPERDWIMRAPTLRRKLALTSKIQDEVGHAQLLYRVAEDLGKPRSQMLADLLDGKTKFHNVFHYPTRSWADVGIIAWLVDAAAIVSQQALRDSSYAPYARTMKKICWEESVHIMHGRDVVLTLMNGTETQRDMVQEALDRWWGPLMQMHGPPTDPAKDKDLHWGIKAKNNEQLRQEFLSIYVPRIRELGLVIPDPELHHDETDGRWHYTEPDWAELKSVVTGHGPASQERLDFRRVSFAETQWVRDALLGNATAPPDGSPFRQIRTTASRSWALLAMDHVAPDRGEPAHGGEHAHHVADRFRRTPELANGTARPAGTLPAMSERVWEVFRQEDEGDPMIHSGNVNAPDEELAMHYAREFYGRRGESHRLWIVPRESITELDDPDLLKPPFDRSAQEAGRLHHQAQARGGEGPRRRGGGRVTRR